MNARSEPSQQHVPRFWVHAYIINKASKSHDNSKKTSKIIRENTIINNALKLVKAIYGLKQAGRQWYKKLDSSLQSLSFQRVKSDNSIWVYRRGDTRIIIPAYVDDMFIASKDLQSARKVVSDLEKQFQLHDLGDTSFLLGVHIVRDRSNRSLSLSQHQYIVDLLESYSMTDCTSVSTLLDPNSKLSKEQCSTTDKEKAQM